MTNRLSFRRASLKDANAIAQIGADTFRTAFGPDNTPEDMETYLATNFNPQEIRSHIEDEASTFLMGYEGGKLYAYAMLKVGALPEPVFGPKPVELTRFYIIEEVIGKGYGSELMGACLEEARKMGHATLWLGVWEKNERAIRFYEKWGFQKIGEKKFILGRDVQNDFIMSRPI